MSPVVFLVIFCFFLTVVVTVRVWIDRAFDGFEIGKAILLTGITGMVFLWASFEEGWLSGNEKRVLAIIVVATLVGGSWLISRHWTNSNAIH